jgi:ActR/RegA family two-component response regulator
MQRRITSRGYRTETALGGLDCPAKLRRATPAVVVLDLELFWGGGDGVLAWLREERTPARVPVILTATAGCPAGATEVIEPPVVQLLFKPFGLTTLLESVRSAVAKGQEAARRAGQGSTLSELFLG